MEEFAFDAVGEAFASDAGTITVKTRDVPADATTVGPTVDAVELFTVRSWTGAKLVHLVAIRFTAAFVKLPAVQFCHRLVDMILVI